MDFPRELRYSVEHCWVLVVGESGRVGLCPQWFMEPAQTVEVSLPTLGLAVRAGEVVATITIAGQQRDVRSPISGSVVLVNERLANDTGPICADPFGRGWLCEMQLAYDETLEQVMDAGTYARMFS